MPGLSTDPSTPDMILDTADACRLQNLYLQSGDLLVWTITANTTDYPHQVVARPHSTLLRTAFRGVLLSDDLDALRNRLPPGLHLLPRAATDDPVIVEVWL